MTMEDRGQDATVGLRDPLEVDGDWREVSERYITTGTGESASGALSRSLATGDYGELINRGTLRSRVALECQWRLLPSYHDACGWQRIDHVL